MNQLNVDFVVKDQASAWQRWALVVLGMGLLTVQGVYLFGQLQPELDSLNASLTKQVQTLHRPAPVSRLKPEAFAALLKQAHEVDQQLNIPWNPLFSFMDRASGKDLALLSLEPDTAKGQLVITAEARNFAAMLNFYAAMQDSALFSDVALQSHAINHNVPEQPIRFRLRALWMIRS